MNRTFIGIVWTGVCFAGFNFSMQKVLHKDTVVQDFKSSLKKTFKLSHVMSGHTDWIRSIAISPDGSRIVSGSNDTTIRVWDVVKAQILCTLQNTSWVLSVDWGPDNNTFAAGFDDGEVRILHIGLKKKCQLLGHSGAVFSVNWSPNKQQIASGSNDTTIRIWDAYFDEAQVLSGHANAVTSVSWASDGVLLASASGDKVVCIWDTVTQQKLKEFTYANWLFAVRWSPDNTKIVIGLQSGGKNLAVQCIGKETPLLLEKHTSGVRGISYSSDGRTLVSGADDTVCIWDAETLQVVQTLPHPLHLFCLHLSSDGSKLIVGAGANGSGCLDSNIYIWDLQ